MSSILSLIKLWLYTVLTFKSSKTLYTCHQRHKQVFEDSSDWGDGWEADFKGCFTFSKADLIFPLSINSANLTEEFLYIETVFVLVSLKSLSQEKILLVISTKANVVWYGLNVFQILEFVSFVALH